MVAFPLLASCVEQGALAPRLGRQVAAGLNTDMPVRISEFHYDNTGTDAGEAIEISGPAGTNLSGYSVVLYNGAAGNGTAYGTTALSATIPSTCGTRGVVVITFPSNGIQNGSPDGIALVGPSGLIEFLSYEGSFVGVGGAANGVTSTDIGVAEVGTESASPVTSLSRSGATMIWTGPATNTFGACNDENEPAAVDSVEVSPSSATVVAGGTQQFTAAAFDAAHLPVPGVVFSWSSTNSTVASVNASGLATGVTPGDAMIIVAAPNGEADTAAIHVDPAPPPGGGSARFSEIHYDNAGTDVGEAIEVDGVAGTSLTGWSIVLYNGSNGASYATISLSGIIADQCSGRGTASFAQAGIQNGNPDGFALINSSAQVVEFLSYGGTFTATNGPALGMTSVDIDAQESGSTPAGSSLQRDVVSGRWFGPIASSFGACNPPPPPPAVRFTGRFPSDPPLPVGFEDQLFAAVIDAFGDTIPTTFTWSSETPALASIDQNGVMHALAAGTAVFRATAAVGGTTNTWSLPTAVATLGGTAQYGNNIEFGQPVDGNAADDVIVNRAQFNASFNPVRGIPNWVSYNLDATHFGPQDRCDCFTFDPLLSGLTPYTTADYTGAGAVAGFGIDRGHLARSFDRTTGSLDNAYTYLFTNIIPQASDQNQGPWAVMETFLGDQARFQNKEVFIVTGASGSKGTVKNEGKITIPATTWKVAVIMDRDEGLGQVAARQDIEVIAVIMPNEGGIANVDWNTYRTTVDAVEALSGYDLLSLLPDQIEIAVESMTSPPQAATDGPYTGSEGTSLSLSGAASTDPDLDALTYSWTFGDGATGSGVSVSHTYAQDGVYTVQLTVTDTRGLTRTTSTTATIGNQAPLIAPLPGATLLPGETYAASGSFTDPGADSWTGTVNYGDGSAVSPLALSGKTFSLSHVYTTAGTFTITVAISDDDVTTTATQGIIVLTPIQAIANAIAMLNALVQSGAIKSSHAIAVRTLMEVTTKLLERGQIGAAREALTAARTQLQNLILNGRIDAAIAAPLELLLSRVIASLA